MNVLITGHKGLIGSILFNGLKKKYTLFGIDINETNTFGKFSKCNISDISFLNRKFQEIYNCFGRAIDIIIYLARRFHRIFSKLRRII